MAATQSAVRSAFAGMVAAVRSQPYYLDITNPAATKGAVVEFAATRLGIHPSAIAVLGDMPNDLDMFEKAGLSIAMGNAEPKVKQAADAVTESNDEDGFALAIDRYVLTGMKNVREPEGRR